MNSRRNLVVGALILNYILTASAAVLKGPVATETSALDGRSSDRLPIGEYQGTLTANFKRSVVDNGRANVAYPGSLAPFKGNTHDVNAASATIYPEAYVTGSAKSFEQINITVRQGIISLIKNNSDVHPLDAREIVSVSNKFAPHGRQSYESSNTPGRQTSESSNMPVDFRAEFSPLDRSIHQSGTRQIVTHGEKFSSESAMHSENKTEESSADALLQAAIDQVTQFLEKPGTASGGAITKGVINEERTTTVDDNQVNPFIGGITGQKRGDNMNSTFYQTVTNETQASGGVFPTEKDVGKIVLGTAVTEGVVSRHGYATSERDGDIFAEVPTTVTPGNLDSDVLEMGKTIEIEPMEVHQADVTTELDVDEMTTIHEEGVAVERKGASSRQFDGQEYHPDAELLSENEIDGMDNDVAAGVGVGDCSRPCEVGGPPRVCKFTFHVEWYHTMSKACFGCPQNASDCDRPHCVPADGIERPIIVVNRQMPGPTVSVCLHDVVQVDVVNEMTEETSSVHWHGQHQRASPHMDGVPFVTQCPIGPASAFRYRFIADTPGTHFWHSHTGCQRADGLYGALVVRTPRAADAHARLYDEEGAVLQLADWGRPLGVDKFANHHHAAGDNKPTSILVNGRGGLHWASGQQGPPPARFTVKQGKRYRFRVINNGFLNCPIQLSVDGHSLLVISSDGADIEPVRAESLVTYAGERWDFVLEATAAVSSYWIRLRGLMDCGKEFTKAHQVAVLEYQGSNLARPAGKVSWEGGDRPGLSLNTLNVGPGTPDALVASELMAAASLPDDASLAPLPDRTFYLGYDFYAIDNPHFHHPKYYSMSQVKDQDFRLFTPQFNHISLRLPSFPLLSQYSDLDESTVCNETTMADQGCETGYCECLHMLRVPLGAIVEIVLVDAGNMYNANHPFHLHGHAFRVVAMGKLGTNTSVEEVRALDRVGGIQRKLRGAPLKDTVTVPDGGFTVLRVSADNPGYWLFHCHIEFHVEVGMAVVFKVGEHSDFPAPPPGFPRCNSWLPPYPSKGQTHSRLGVATSNALTDHHQPSSAPTISASVHAALLLLFTMLTSLTIS